MSRRGGEEGRRGAQNQAILSIIVLY